jgi:uncharacterized protein YlxW (UPF0749 family)
LKLFFYRHVARIFFSKHLLKEKMLKSPNNVQIEANQGRGEIIVRGYMKAERARVENLSAPILESMQRQLEELRLQIAASSSSSSSSSAVSTPVPVPAPAAPVPVPVPVATSPAASTSQVFKLQEQIATLNARLNTLQDRMQAMEARLASSSSSSSVAASAGAGGVGRMVSDVANAVVAGVAAEVSQAATEQIHKAAMKLEDMVSPGALYNLRKVSRENVKFAW